MVPGAAWPHLAGRAGGVLAAGECGVVGDVAPLIRPGPAAGVIPYGQAALSSLGWAMREAGFRSVDPHRAELESSIDGYDHAAGWPRGLIAATGPCTICRRSRPKDGTDKPPYGIVLVASCQIEDVPRPSARVRPAVRPVPSNGSIAQNHQHQRCQVSAAPAHLHLAAGRTHQHARAREVLSAAPSWSTFTADTVATWSETPDHNSFSHLQLPAARVATFPASMPTTGDLLARRHRLRRHRQSPLALLLQPVSGCSSIPTRARRSRSTS